jgi:hypothetical protein
LGREDCPLLAAAADICSAAKQLLLDDLVGKRCDRRRNVDAERFGGPQIYEKLELRRKHHRQVCRSFAFEDASGVYANLTPRLVDPPSPSTGPECRATKHTKGNRISMDNF